MRAAVVDLFCGVGGLSYGFKREGFDVKAGIDTDGLCQYAYEKNVGARFLAQDIRKLAVSDVSKFFTSGNSKYRILIGCAPCAPFSLYTGRYRKARRHDKSRKWELLKEFLRIVLATNPDVVSMENVPRLRRHPVFHHFVSGLRSNGYTVTYYEVRADHYGVPQQRARLVLFASKFGAVEMLPETHLDNPITVRDAIGKLPRVNAGVACPSDRLHVSRSLSEKNLLRVMSTSEGGGWKDWPEDLVLACHKKKKGKSFRSVYGRMKWNSVAPVITTECLGIGNGRFGHPEQHRAISIREAALLQTFPKKFRFVPPREPVIGLHLARQIGNAVPVRLAQIIARSIKRHLKTSAAVSAAGVSSLSRHKPRRDP
jgi:DNA (cytosine-5)-methyltransferase 1